MKEIIRDGCECKRVDVFAQKICRECGASFAAQRATREFCGGSCRRKFHNRRALRGAEFYDLVMIMRHDRGAAGVSWMLLSRMAAAFRAEDRRDRSGRASWDDVAKVRARNPHLIATVVGVNVAGTRTPGQNV